MSLTNITTVFQATEQRAQAAESQLLEQQQLIAQWFLDDNEGARQWLRAIAEEHRRAHPFPEPPQRRAAPADGGSRLGSAGAVGVGVGE